MSMTDTPSTPSESAVDTLRRPAPTSVDRELAAVLITLAPLGARGLQYVDTERREFDWRQMHDTAPWSTGESWLIRVAGALWTGNAGMIDLAYIAGLSGPFFAAVVNGIAAYRGADFTTDWTRALDEVTR